MTDETVRWTKKDMIYVSVKALKGLIEAAERAGYERIQFVHGRPLITQELAKHMDCPYPPGDDL